MASGAPSPLSLCLVLPHPKTLAVYAVSGDEDFEKRAEKGMQREHWAAGGQYQDPLEKLDEIENAQEFSVKVSGNGLIVLSLGPNISFPFLELIYVR